jgi:type VI secretion system protein ImpK
MTSDETFIGPTPNTTIRLPNPGGRRLPNAAETPLPTTDVSERLWSTIRLEKLNPIVAAAAPLLNLATQLKQRIEHGDVEALRMRVMRGIDQFERRIAPIGLALRSVRASKYALCATLDDLVLNTPWGSRSVWTTRSLVGTFFSETWGGDRFFDLLAQLKKDPGVNIDLLELLYCCISLGFEGKYRVTERGASQLLMLRDDLYRLIRSVRGEFERDISPHWRGIQAGYRGLTSNIPNWVMAVSAAGLLLALYAVLLFVLNSASDPAFAALANLPPNGPVSLARIAPPPPPAPPVAVDQVDRLRGSLQPDLQAGQVAVLDDAQTITLRIIGAGLFASGSADAQPGFALLLGHIGTAINDQPGNILITGHTDNAPIHTLRFPSNYDLSLARARAVAAMIQAQMRDPGRVTAEGRADTQPIAPDTTETGRQQNRRVDLLITKAN